MRSCDEFLLVFGRVAELAPDFGEAGGEFFVAEAADLAGLEGAEVGGGDFAGFDLVEEAGGEGGPGDERFDDGGALDGMERAVAFGELLAERRVVEEREALHGGGVEEADAEELLADVSQVVGRASMSVSRAACRCGTLARSSRATRRTSSRARPSPKTTARLRTWS